MITELADYRILRPLGGSDEEQFFLAVPPPRLGLGEGLVAMKVVSGLADEEQVRRATNELRIFASVQSPYVVTLYDAGQDADVLFYAMEFPALGTLAEPTRPLSFEERLRAVSDAARGAHALHEAGLAHRNITPVRILVGETGAKLAELGLAKFISPGMTVTRAASIGDIEYLDPAVLRGERASRATDVWSLGVTLHWTLSGGTPIHPDLPGGDTLAAVRRVLNEPPQIAASLSAEARAVIARALAGDPAERYLTAQELADAIDGLRSER
jgi:serine/threonine protein kinase